MNQAKILITFFLLGIFNICCTNSHPTQAQQANILSPQLFEKQPKIQVALLLDTSGSMDGLINQAKSQIWKMVNELAITKKNGQSPDIEIALYDFGNSSISAEAGYVRQHTPFTTDLDMVSEKLFELSTNGGEEYCGKAIQVSTKDLNWSDNNGDLKLIIIAGNEPFTQGPIDYKQACKNAITKGIMVNTIHCGDYDEGVRSSWKDGADLTDGKYMNINQDEEVVHIQTPFDTKIIELNNSLNSTFLGYGSEGKMRKKRQVTQDSNASSFGIANEVERTVAKTTAAYKPTSWDIVSAAIAEPEILEEAEEEALPEQMQGMNKEERVKFVEEKSAERKKIQEEITNLNNQRQAFITKQQKENAEALTLDNVMINTIREQAVSKKFNFED